jgi:hypothetical protein
MKVLVLHGGSCVAELGQLRRWLEAEECEVAVFDLDTLGGVPQQGSVTELAAECDATVLLVNRDLPLAEVQAAVLAAHAKGKKIISVQLGEPIYSEGFEKYGFASIPLKQNLVVGAVCNDLYAWLDDDEQPREEPDTERHKCKKQKNAAA